MPVLRPGTPNIPDLEGLEHCLDVIFERVTHPGIASVLDNQRKREEGVQVGVVFGQESLFNAFGDDAPLEALE